MPMTFPAMADTNTHVTADSARALYSLGYRAVGRYTRSITLAEARAIWSAGLDLLLIIESSETESFGTYQQGYDRYLSQMLKMQEKIGWSIHRPLYLTTDRNTATYSQVSPYYNGAHDAARQNLLALPGGYGPKPLVKELLRRGLISFAWGVNSWPHSEPATSCSLIQFWPPVTRGGIEIDHNNILTADIGAWNPAHPTPWPDPPTEEPFTVAQYEEIIKRLDAQDKILARLQSDYLTKGESMRQVILHTEALVEAIKTSDA